MQNTTELNGILQAISIVAKSLSLKLIEKDVAAYESDAGIAAGKRKTKKGWK